VLSLIGRALATLFLCVFLIGFGVCGALGAINGASAIVSSGAGGEGTLFVVLGILGLLIAFGCGTAIAGLWRKPPPAK
jgi:hypothetical protein